jgi:hypothetical protein
MVGVSPKTCVILSKKIRRSRLPAGKKNKKNLKIEKFQHI